MFSAELLESIISSIGTDLESVLNATNSKVLTAKEARIMVLWTWLCKALVLRSDKHQIHLLEKVNWFSLFPCNCLT
jgi:hypothetical protein